LREKGAVIEERKRKPQLCLLKVSIYKKQRKTKEAFLNSKGSLINTQ
jgi:hypothetical protein